MEQNEERMDYTFEQEAAQPQPEQPQAEQPQEPKKKKGKTAGLIAVVVVVALLAGIGGAMLTDTIKNVASKNEAEPAMSEQAIEPSKQGSKEDYSLQEQKLPETLKTNKGNKSLTAAQVYENNVNSVVGIRTEAITTNIWGQITQFSSSGTGFILSEDGYIVTNNHVISDGNTVTVALYNGEEYEAKVIGADKVNDVALIKIDKTGLQPVSIGKSKDLTVGEEVIAIGNPLGELTFTMTHGYISALDRYINTSGTPINMLQTDAAINAGNSGGPLFDMNGNVIAMNTAKPSSSIANGTTVEGIGFAIPIDDVLEIVYDLQDGQISGRAFLGITPRDLDQTTADTYHLPMGVYVTGVEDGYCAKEAGIEQGDIILAVNGKEVKSTSELRAELNRLKAGDEATLKLYRGGAETEVTVTLDEAPAEEQTNESQQQQQQEEGRSYTIDPSQLFPSFSFGF